MIEEKKIRVVFLPADGSSGTPMNKQVNGTVSTRSILDLSVV